MYKIYKKHLNAIVHMILYIFCISIFLTLHNFYSHVLGSLPTALITHLKTVYHTTIKNEVTQIIKLMQQLLFSMDNVMKNFFQVYNFSTYFHFQRSLMFVLMRNSLFPIRVALTMVFHDHVPLLLCFIPPC